MTPPALLANPVRNVRVTRGDPSRGAMSVQRFAETVRQALSAPASGQGTPPRAGERAPVGGPARTVKKVLSQEPHASSHDAQTIRRRGALRMARAWPRGAGFRVPDVRRQGREPLRAGEVEPPPRAGTTSRTAAPPASPPLISATLPRGHSPRGRVWRRPPCRRRSPASLPPSLTTRTTRTRWASPRARTFRACSAAPATSSMTQRARSSRPTS